MDLLARFLLCMLCIAIIIPLREALRLNYSYCKPQGITGASLFCNECYSDAECDNAKEVECTQQSAERTMQAILKIFDKAESTIKPVERFMCVTFRSKRLDGMQSVVKGCLYYTEENIIFNHRFYYLRFYKHVTYSKRFAFYTYRYYVEWHDRVYWNKTHFISTHCWFCGDRSCNKMLLKKGARILFQRKFLFSHDAECGMLYAHNFEDFKRKCDQNSVDRGCKNWWWPTVTYRPYPKVDWN